MCHGELKLGYLKKTYIVTMQTYQMAMLLLFESCDSLTCKDIQSTLQLNSETFQKHLQSLLESKLLNANSENLEGNTKIELNFDYSNKRTKFKITSAMQKETQQEVSEGKNSGKEKCEYFYLHILQQIEHTISAVDEDRKLYLQAAIVRIMKSRKVLKHNALIQEVCGVFFFILFMFIFANEKIFSHIDFITIESEFYTKYFNDKKVHRIVD